MRKIVFTGDNEQTKIIHEKAEFFLRRLAFHLPSYNELPKNIKDKLLLDLYRLIGDGTREILNSAIKDSFEISRYEEIDLVDFDKESTDIKVTNLDDLINKFGCLRKIDKEEYLTQNAADKQKELKEMIAKAYKELKNEQ